MSVELATAYVSIVPSAKGIGGKIAAELAPIEAAAKASGAKAGSSLSASLLGATKGVSGKLVGGLGIAAVGLAALNAAKTVDSAYDTIRSGTGKTGAQLDSLKASFRNVVSDVPAEFGTASSVIAALNQRLDATGPRLEGLSKRVLEFSRLTKTDAVQNVADLTRVFGDWSIGTNQQSDALDKIFRTTQSTGVGLNDLAQNVVQFGAPLRNLGFTFEQSLAMFGKFEKEGVNVQTVLAGLRFGLKTFAKAGEEPIDALQRAISEIKNAGTAAEANGLAFQVFGLRAGPDMAAAIREGRFELKDLINEIENGDDTILGAASSTDDLGESLTILKNRATLLLAEIGTPIFETLSDSAQAALPVVGSLADVLGFLKPTLVPATLALAAFFAASKLGVPVLGLLNTGVKKVALSAASIGAEKSFSGLAGLSSGLTNLGSKLPGIAATGAIAASTFGGIGDSAESSVIGIGSMVAAGAAVGSVFPGAGTAIGAVAGGVVGLGKAMLDGGEDVETYRGKFAGLGAEIEALSAKGAANKFLSNLGFTDTLGFFKGSAKAITDELQALASKSPAAASVVVQGLKSMRDEAGKPLFTGKELDKLEAAVNKGEAGLQRFNQRKADAATENSKFQAGELGNADAIGKVGDKASYSKSQLQGLQDVIVASAGGQIGYEQSVLNVAKAQEELNTARSSGTATAAEIHAAELNLQSAQLASVTAAQTLDQAQAALTKKYGDNVTAVDAEIASLQRQAEQHPESAAAYQVLIDKLVWYKASIDTIPPAKDTKVGLDTSEAYTALGALQTALIAFGNQTIRAKVGVSGADVFPGLPQGKAGMLIPGPKDRPFPMIAHGGERVLNFQETQAWDKLTDGGTAAGPLTVSPAGPGYGGVNVVSHWHIEGNGDEFLETKIRTAQERHDRELEMLLRSA